MSEFVFPTTVLLCLERQVASVLFKISPYDEIFIGACRISGEVGPGTHEVYISEEVEFISMLNDGVVDYRFEDTVEVCLYF